MDLGFLQQQDGNFFDDSWRLVIDDYQIGLHFRRYRKPRSVSDNSNTCWAIFVQVLRQIRNITMYIYDKKEKYDSDSARGTSFSNKFSFFPKQNVECFSSNIK